MFHFAVFDLSLVLSELMAHAQSDLATVFDARNLESGFAVSRPGHANAREHGLAYLDEAGGTDRTYAGIHFCRQSAPSLFAVERGGA